MEFQIVDYRPELKEDFKLLNEWWIKQYFEMEETDNKSLYYPEEYILEKGGIIIFAMEGDKAVGTVALIKMYKGYDYELAKMGVHPDYHGKGLGTLLGQAIIEKAKSLGARSIYLESNTVLKPAIQLYRKLGFEEVKGVATPYSRCNIQMELKL